MQATVGDGGGDYGLFIKVFKSTWSRVLVFVGVWLCLIYYLCCRDMSLVCLVTSTAIVSVSRGIIFSSFLGVMIGLWGESMESTFGVPFC